MTGYGNIKKQDCKYSKVNRNKVILDFAGVAWSQMARFKQY